MPFEFDTSVETSEFRKETFEDQSMVPQFERYLTKTSVSMTITTWQELPLSLQYYRVFIDGESFERD